VVQLRPVGGHARHRHRIHRPCRKRSNSPRSVAWTGRWRAAAIWATDHPRLAELLEDDGWTHAPEAGEDGSTLYRRGDVRLEVAFLARADDGEIHTPLRDGRATWAAQLRGVRARVIALPALRVEKSAVHGDASAAAKDRADLATLAGVPER
jgi:hypothetical protein